MNRELEKRGSSLLILRGDPVVEIPKLVRKLKCSGLFFNRSAGTYGRKRDNQVVATLEGEGMSCQSFLDHVHFDPADVLNGQGLPYKVFTPYKRRWMEIWAERDHSIPLYHPDLKKMGSVPSALEKLKFSSRDWFKVMGFKPQKNVLVGGAREAKKRLRGFAKKIDSYHLTRDIPSAEGVSGLSPYLRFGNISIRDCLRLVREHSSEGAETWLTELIWREFYNAIYFHFPHVENRSFNKKYEQLEWTGTAAMFTAWKKGATGFPIVDAAMRCLNQTGLMPNRLRMVTASFLCKTLIVDWKKGERYFAQKLLDFELASNNGGWQWCSSTGTDAQPYFRVFNPWNQSKKFDKDGHFLRQWCPELAAFDNRHIHAPHLAKETADYPDPIVSYEEKRKEVLLLYKGA